MNKAVLKGWKLIHTYSDGRESYERGTGELLMIYPDGEWDYFINYSLGAKIKPYKSGNTYQELEDMLMGTQKKEDIKRLNLPTQDFPNKLSVSIGEPIGGHDQRPRENRKRRGKHMHMKKESVNKAQALLQELGEEMVSGQGMDDIEDLIDKHGLEAICDAISHICNEKADHVRSTWQDEPMAKAWEKNAKLFDALTAKLASTT